MSASLTSGTTPRARATSPWLRRSALATWRFLARLGQRRAVPHLLALAQRLDQSNPALARQMRETAARGLL